MTKEQWKQKRTKKTNGIICFGDTNGIILIKHIEKVYPVYIDSSKGLIYFDIGLLSGETHRRKLEFNKKYNTKTQTTFFGSKRNVNIEYTNEEYWNCSDFPEREQIVSDYEKIKKIIKNYTKKTII